jgi:hypothetical protein
MRLKNWKEIINTDWPELKITERTREMAPVYAQRYLTGNVRFATGRFYTDEEFEKYRQRVLSTPFP